MEVQVRVSAHRTEWHNGNALELHSEGQLSRILHDFYPHYLQARTVSLFRSITSFTSHSRVDATCAIWDAESHAVNKKEVPPPGLQAIPTETVATSRNLFITTTRGYSETGVNSLLSNPYLLTMHDFTVFSLLCYFCSRNSTANHLKYSDHLCATGFNIQKF